MGKALSVIFPNSTEGKTSIIAISYQNELG